MTKNTAVENTENTENTEAPATAEAVAAPAAGAKSDSRHIMIKDPTSGEMVKRVDYIRRRWQEGAERGAIAKELTQITGSKVPYQIVFAGTKGIAGGPVKAPAEATPASEPAAEAVAE